MLEIIKKIIHYYKRIALKLPRVKSLAAKPLIIADFSGYNQPFHPSVLYLKEGFSGYKYWMVQTPLPIGGLPYRDRWECPCVYYSNDGIKWDTNIRINPIDDLDSDEISNGDYFSDPHLVYRNDSKMLECWYRITHINKKNRKKQLQYPTYVVRKISKDGLHWSTRELLIDLQDNNSLDNMVRSPSIIWDLDNKIYRMWYVDTLPTLDNRKIIYAESENGIKWKRKTDVIMDKYIDPWHIDVNYFDNKYHLINYTLTGNEGINYYDSSDGINFKFTKEILKPSILSINSFYRAQLYRSCSVKIDDEIRVYFSASDGLKTYIGVLIGENFENLRIISCSSN